MFDTIPPLIEPSAEELSARSRVQSIIGLLRRADELTAKALSLLGRGGIEAVTGMPVEMMLTYEARCTGSEAKMMTQAAGVLREMPRLAAAFSSGLVSWGQVRWIVLSLKNLKISDRAEVDELIGSRAAQLAEGSPESLLEWVDAEADKRRPDLALRWEDQAITASFLSIQGRFDGGSSIYGEADPEGTASIVAALDAVAPAPVHRDEGISRAQQYMGALVTICESTLAGATGGSARPRPRLLATLDVAGMTDEAKDQAITLLTSLAGRTPRLTKVSRDVLLCDATIVPVIFDGAHPIEVGDASSVFSDKVRTAIIARDKRCRFCQNSPASWCDAHHLIPGTGRSVTDGALLCRPCHRRVHRYDWKMRWLEDGALEFRRRGEYFVSLPP